MSVESFEQQRREMIAAIRVVAQHLAAEVGKTALDDRVLATMAKVRPECRLVGSLKQREQRLDRDDRPTFPDVPARPSCHQAAKLAGWFGAYSALFSMPEMFYIEPVNELVEELTRGAVMAV